MTTTALTELPYYLQTTFDKIITDRKSMETPSPSREAAEVKGCGVTLFSTSSSKLMLLEEFTLFPYKPYSTPVEIATCPERGFLGLVIEVTTQCSFRHQLIIFMPPLAECGVLASKSPRKKDSLYFNRAKTVFAIIPSVLILPADQGHSLPA